MNVNKSAILAAVIFIIVSHPYTYSLTSKIVPVVKLTKSECGACPTDAGLLAHAAVVFALSQFIVPAILNKM